MQNIDFLPECIKRRRRRRQKMIRNAYVLAACVGLPALGMWFDQRWCGYVFAAIMVISIPLALIAFLTVDDTLVERAYRLARIGMAGYFAFITFRWAQDA